MFPGWWTPTTAGVRPPPCPQSAVASGTSGHRGSSFDASFSQAHPLAISQAICLCRGRQGIDGPLLVGIDTHALSHAFGADFDNPQLIVACMIGAGEAETGPLATAWHSHTFLNPARDDAVSILHLNGYQIGSPTLLAHIDPQELDALLRGYGYYPRYVEGAEPAAMHQCMAAVLDEDLIRSDRQAGTPPRLADEVTSLGVMLTLVGAGYGYGYGFAIASQMQMLQRPDISIRPWPASHRCSLPTCCATKANPRRP